MLNSNNSNSEYSHFNSGFIAFSFLKPQLKINYESSSDITSEKIFISHEEAQSDNSSSSINLIDKYRSLLKILSYQVSEDKDNFLKEDLGSSEQIKTYLTDLFIAYRLFHDELSEKDISDFCLKNNLLIHLRIAVDIAKESFSNYRNIHFSLEGDPETDEQWISFNLDVEGDIESIFEEYQNYNKNLIKNIPWPERDLIRLNYNLI
ncbi:MAG: hypothetical protein KJ737_22950 [Proteobacteria bacterium]|nr:hypothetical protein [Pseudomonadota bacterium]